jgi:hypothetical protein
LQLCAHRKSLIRCVSYHVPAGPARPAVVAVVYPHGSMIWFPK